MRDGDSNGHCNSRCVPSPDATQRQEPTRCALIRTHMHSRGQTEAGIDTDGMFDYLQYLQEQEATDEGRKKGALSVCLLVPGSQAVASLRPPSLDA